MITLYKLIHILPDNVACAGAIEAKDGDKAVLSSKGPPPSSSASAWQPSIPQTRELECVDARKALSVASDGLFRAQGSFAEKIDKLRKR